jgi:hypothetical protein
LRDGNVTVDLPLDKVEVRDLGDLRHHAIECEALVLSAIDQEPDQRLQVHSVGGHAEIDLGRSAGRIAHCSRVADAAIEPGAIDKDAALREADRQVSALLLDESERGVSLAGQLIRKQRREYFQNPVGHTVGQLAADGAVLEMLFDGHVVHRPVGIQPPQKVNHQGGDSKSKKQKTPAAPPAEFLFDRC